MKNDVCDVSGGVSGLTTDLSLAGRGNPQKASQTSSVSFGHQTDWLSEFDRLQREIQRAYWEAIAAKEHS
jgi:hypothetical protein